MDDTTNAADMASLYRAVSEAMDRSNAQQTAGLLGSGSLFDTSSANNAPGLIAPGNINIHQRPVVRNADGSISTVRSASFEDDDGRNVLIPTVIGGRGVVPVDEAIKHYRQTGQHLGIFDSEENATAYAKSLHEQQAGEYR
jgi:hypothetical protein